LDLLAADHLAEVGSLAAGFVLGSPLELVVLGVVMPVVLVEGPLVLEVVRLVRMMKGLPLD
jgi:hypothetical protein